MKVKLKKFSLNDQLAIFAAHNAGLTTLSILPRNDHDRTVYGDPLVLIGAHASLNEGLRDALRGENSAYIFAESCDLIPNHG